MSLKTALPTTIAEDSELALAELVEQFIERLQASEAVDPQAFADENPQNSEALLGLLPAAAIMARLRLSSARPEGHSSSFNLESQVIGDYRVVREVGRGGMGVVYEAEQASTGRKVALKVLPISSASDPRQVRRFLIEGQAAAALDHPHIVPVYAIGCEQGVHFYAMRFIEGCSVAALIHEGRFGRPSTTLGHREAARLALEAAEALAHAHQQGIVHRDVKPANLLVEPSGHLWVVDFGLARFLEGGYLTRTGDVIGTLRYLSPEQAEGRRELDARTDVYNLGATLYELTTLRPAFDGQDRHELLRKIAFVKPTPPRRIDSTIPRDLERILASAMAKAVEDRYASASELADDLRRFVEGRPIVARRPYLGSRLNRWARRNRVMVMIATAVLALFLVGTGIGVALLLREQVRTRENFRLALLALDEFCLAATGPELARDPERSQEIQDLQLRALGIYERMLVQNPDDPDARWVAARAEHRVANILARTPRVLEAGPAFEAAHRNLTLILGREPRRVESRREAADLLSDWGASKVVGGPGGEELRRRALDEHLRLASEFPGESRDRRAAARDCIEVARTIGILDPAEASEKEALFRRAVNLREAVQDRSFASRSELAEALGFLGHLLNATRRRGEGEEVLTRGRSLHATLDVESSGDPARRQSVVSLQELFALPRYCEPSPDPETTLAAHQASLDGQARLVEEFPFLPDFRASLAWAHHVQASTLKNFHRLPEAEDHERRSLAMFEPLLHEHPAVDHYRRWASAVAEGLGQILEEKGRREEARTAYRRAIAIRPESPGLRSRITRRLNDGGDGPRSVELPTARTNSAIGR